MIERRCGRNSLFVDERAVKAIVVLEYILRAVNLYLRVLARDHSCPAIDHDRAFRIAAQPYIAGPELKRRASRFIDQLSTIQTA